MASNFGGLIQTVAAAWMMTALTGNAEMVALVQTSATLPMMLISLPAGALADIYERRNIMLIAQSAMLVVATVLTGLTFAAITTPFVRLSATRSEERRGGKGCVSTCRSRWSRVH